MATHRRQALIIARDRDVIDPLADGLRAEGIDTATATSRADAIDQILLAERLDFVVVGHALDDGSGLDVARTATLTLPTPYVLTFAEGWTIEEAFALGAFGVHGILPQPITAASVLEAFARIEREAPPPIYSLLARYVGRVSLLAFEREVRRSLLMQALDRSEGSRTGAARLLRTSRQLVQKVANGEGD